MEMRAMRCFRVPSHFASAKKREGTIGVPTKRLTKRGNAKMDYEK
jgi:hypothetical protein